MTDAKTLLSFPQVMDALDAFVNYERVTDYKAGPLALGTERMELLLERLGHPEAAAPALHIAGTKGKGSIAYLCARLLHALGYRVGLYLSPHVSHICERIQVDTQPVREAFFCECFAQVQPAVDAMREHPALKPPTYFEILTALAFVAFQRAKVQVSVVEVGLGGRLDATNVSRLPVCASAISTISRDHMKQLGDDLVTIAGEKAGILRPGVPLIMAPQEPAVARHLRQRCAALSCPLHVVGEDLTAALRETPPTNAPEAPQRLDLTTWRAVHRDVPLPLLGDHQQPNAAVALALAETFLQQRELGPVDTASLRRAWREAAIPGRIEVVARRPWVVLDGAHNTASAWGLAETLRQRFSTTKRVLVFAAARDKEIMPMLKILAPLAQAIVLTSIPSPRSMDPDAVADHVRATYPARLHLSPDPGTALARARQLAGPDGLVCATGSLYLVGALHPTADAPASPGDGCSPEFPSPAPLPCRTSDNLRYLLQHAAETPGIPEWAGGFTGRTH